MMVVPGPTAVTGTVAVVAFPAKVTLDGTEATLAFAELIEIVNPPTGAGADKFRVTFWVALPVSVKAFGEKLTVAFTCTVTLAGAKLGADADRLDEPKFTPLTWGCVSGVVLPAGIVTLEGETTTRVVSLLLIVTVTPPAGAAVPSVTGNVANWPGATDKFAGRLIVPGGTTLTLAVVSVTFGKALA